MPFENVDSQAKFLQLVREGVAEWSGEKPHGMTTRIKSKEKSVSEAVVKDRR